MNKGDIFSAIGEKSKVFTFNIEPVNYFQKLLQSIKVMPKTRSIEVKPIKYGVRAICSSYLIGISLDSYSKMSLQSSSNAISFKELDKIFMFLSYVLWNKESLPPSWLIKAVRNLDQEGIDEVIEFSKSSLDTTAFFNSIISLVGMSLQAEEIIAPENESQAHTK